MATTAITIDEMIAELQYAKEEFGGDMKLAWDQYGQNGYSSPVDGMTYQVILIEGERHLLIDISDDSFEYEDEK